MSKELLNQENLTRDIIAAAETHAASITQSFEERFWPYATADEKKKGLPDLGLAVLLLARAAADKREKAIAAVAEHEKELSDDDPHRRKRDGATSALTTLTVNIRGSIDNIYGESGIKLFGLSGRTLTDPKPLLEHARKLLGRLKDKDLAWPEPVHEGVTVNPAVWVSKLEPLIAELDEALTKVAIEEREAQVTGTAKNKALAELDEVLVPAGDLTATGLLLAGQVELAERIWPTVRRPRGSAADAGGAPAKPKEGKAPSPPAGG